MKNNPYFRCAAVLCAASVGAFLVSRQATFAAAPAKPLSSFDPQAKALLAQMTLEEKIGQMTQPDQESIKDLSDIERYFVGSILSGGSSDPKEGNSLQAWTDLYDRLQRHTSLTRLKIPILYGVDAVHGHNNILGAVIFPLHAQSRVGGKGGAGHRRRGPRHRNSMGVRAVRHCAAGYPLGPHL
jgi:hypothetical protein